MISPKVFYDEHFKIPEEYSSQVEKKNLKVLKVLFTIAHVFGLLVSIYVLIYIALKKPENLIASIYYFSMILFGGIGLLLIRLKVPSKIGIVYALFVLEFMYVFFLKESTLVNAIIIFLGLSFVFIMFLEVNPIVFTVFLGISLTMLVCFQRIDFFYSSLRSHSDILIKNFLLLFFTLIYLGFWKRKHVVEDFKHELKLKKEQVQTDSVLSNIFPKKVIEQMKDTGVIEAEEYDSVSVLYSDIVNFTKTASSLEPKVVIDELNEIFTAFDEITEKYDCMRIKTVGDAYIAVCGLLEDNPHHAENIIRCAKEFLAYLEEKNSKSQVQWKIRIGIASGKVAAGVVGLRKYIYDIFGETVDCAEQIETNGSAMKIAISKETGELVKDNFIITEEGGCYYV